MEFKQEENSLARVPHRVPPSEGNVDLDPLKFEKGQSGLREKKTRDQRIFYSGEQLDFLENLYGQTSGYPDVSARKEAAQRINLPEAKVIVWFQNRRAKARKQGKDKDLRPKYQYPPLPTHPLSNHPHEPSDQLASQHSTYSRRHLDLLMQTKQSSKSDVHPLLGLSPSPPLYMKSHKQDTSDRDQPGMLHLNSRDSIYSQSKKSCFKPKPVTISIEFEPILIQLLLQAPLLN
eukprot:GFUD01043415.1.p1 GENE.GFUD01043415.1~~GFUD01043415.1.p1  ORF type:complete len:233 (-),score=46.12 GFUD01043415.1:32-730(-)